MQQVPFIIKELSIDKMPGFPKGMEPFKAISPHINIVAGPNASGKSSTARAIHQMVWHRKDYFIQAEGFADIGGDSWKIKLDFGHIEIQRNGQEDMLSGFPSSETQNRYMLALHELVNTDEKLLASHIVRESIGGYNLEAAAEKLGYSATVRSKTSAEYRKVQEAENNLKAVQQNQGRLIKEEERLQNLYSRQKRAREASTYKDFYDRIIVYLEAKQKVEQNKRSFALYPTVMERLNGEEYSRIQELEKDIAHAEKDLRDKQKKIEKDQVELKALNLPDGGVSDIILGELDERISTLKEEEREIREINQKILHHETEANSFLNDIDPSIDPATWKGIDLGNLQNLEHFLFQAHQTIVQYQYLQTEIQELQKHVESSPSVPSELLKQGIGILSYWLQSQRNSKGTSRRWVIILTSAGGILAALVYFTGWPALTGILLLSFLAYLALKSEASETLSIRESDYQASGLPLPESWTIEQVRETLQMLVEKFQAAKKVEMHHQRLEQAMGELEGINDRLKEIQKTYDQWIELLKTAPPLPKEDTRSYSGLYMFIMNLNKWQRARTEAEKFKSQQKELIINRNKLLNLINTRFEACLTEKGQDYGEVEALFKNLKEQEAKRRNYIAEIQRQEEIVEERSKDIRKGKEKLGDIYQKLGVEYGDKERIRQLVEQLDTYQTVRENYVFSNRQLTEKWHQVKGHSLHEQMGESVYYFTLDHAREKAQGYKEEAGKLEAVNKEITEIETHIHNAKKGNALEEAQLKRQQALDELEALYEQNLSSVTGKLLVDRLKRDTREHNHPAVFNRANQLFNRITGGRYELMLHGQDEAAFTALDTVLREGQQLSELSTGTQIQLLLSVRLAFIESQETSIKLPLLADELLANSDDVRSRAIIDALVEISRDGRQIFYFTAQADELAKWKSYLAASKDITYETILLTGKRNETVDIRDEKIVDAYAPEMNQIPSPENKSHEQYGKELDVPSFDPLTDEITQIHLWYLLEDNQLLYRCLKNGLTFWGQLDSYLKYGGKMKGLDETQIRKLNDQVKVIRRFQELYVQGRSKPVDRSILLESGAISEKFMDKVDEQLKALRGNPAALLRTLSEGKVQGFRKNKIEELEQFLLENGYIDDQAPLQPEALWINLKALISTLSIDQREAEKLIYRFMPT
jgi:uncharacterized protein YhaN